MEAIKKTQHVPLTPKSAFDLFLRDMDQWWPKQSHSVFGQDSKLEIAPHKGGEITEVGPDGRRAAWGKIIGWEEGAYLAIHWYPGRDVDEATVLTIRFEADKNGTCLTLEHGGFDILGPTADAVSTSYLTGWDLVLGSYVTAAAQSVAYA